MIRSFRSRALRRYWERDDATRLPPNRVHRIALVLDTLDAATKPHDLALSGFGFHALTGDQDGRFAVTVSANWRITFGWEGEDAIHVDFEDYH